MWTSDQRRLFQEVSHVRESWDDDLLDMLREAVNAREAVPPHFIETAKSSFAWRNIDAELAQLTYDSGAERELASVRSETASVRALTFTSAHLYIELEVTQNSLIGQVMPGRAGHVETQSHSGPTMTVSIDEIGCFIVEPLPASPFRLRCRVQDQPDVITGWISL
jgi:hypothetical protein